MYDTLTSVNGGVAKFTVDVSGNMTAVRTLSVTGLTSLVYAVVSGTLGVTGLTSLVNAALSGTFRKT